MTSKRNALIAVMAIGLATGGNVGIALAETSQARIEALERDVTDLKQEVDEIKASLNQQASAASDSGMGMGMMKNGMGMGMDMMQKGKAQAGMPSQQGPATGGSVQGGNMGQGGGMGDM